MKPNSMIKATVFIVDDDAEIRHSLQWLLESIRLHVRCYESANDFLNDYDPSCLGCLIVDVRMPGMSGLELLEQLRIRKNHLPIIVITGHGDIPMAVRAMKVGAIDFISKPFNDQQLLEQIQNAITLQTNSISIESSENNQVLLASLTVREREVLDLILSGKLNKQIAHELNIGISTVELHRSRVMQKMHAKNLVQLIKLCLSVNH